MTETSMRPKTFWRSDRPLLRMELGEDLVASCDKAPGVEVRTITTAAHAERASSAFRPGRMSSIRRTIPPRNWLSHDAGGGLYVRDRPGLDSDAGCRSGFRCLRYEGRDPW